MDYIETFAPLTKMTSFHMSFLARSSSKGSLHENTTKAPSHPLKASMEVEEIYLRAQTIYLGHCTQVLAMFSLISVSGV